MKKLVIVNVGSAPAKQLEKYGDFEYWAEAVIREQRVDIQRHDGINQPLPDLDTISGVIIMGSLSMATEKKPWMLQLSEQILALIEHQIPLLGICFGHQLIAQALGGEVGFHPKGLEAGTVMVNRLINAQSDPLFSPLPEQFPAHTVHFQSVLNLPPQAVLLAANEFEPHHAFRVGESTWGVQFHPEFNTAIMRDTLTSLHEQLGDDYSAKHAAVQDTDAATQILNRFAALCATK